MKKLTRILLLVFTASLFSSETSQLPPLDKTRPHLEKLKDKKEVKYDDYELPYLTMQTARVIDARAALTKQKIEKVLQENRIDKAKLVMPSFFSKGDQLEAIEECTEKKCNMKLSLSDEAKKIEGTPLNLKVEAYSEAIHERFKSYINTGELKGYEDRKSNESTIIEMVKLQEFLKYKYPEATKFFINASWKNRKLIERKGFLTNEMVVIAPDKLQPIWRIGEVFEFSEGGNCIFLHLHIYSNHYFDASLTVYEIIPRGEKSVVVITDILEVDELKKSGFVRALFKGKMVDAVSLSQDNFMKKIE